MVQKTYEEEDASSDEDEDVDVFYPDMDMTASRDEEIAEALNDDLDINDTLTKMSITPKESLLKKRFDNKSQRPMQMPSKLRPSMSPE